MVFSVYPLCLMKRAHYYTLAEAEEIRQTYSSWVGKTAHIGAGSHELLKNISIRSNSDNFPNGKSLVVEFEFENGRTFSAYEFSVNNGLVPVTGDISD
jgi:hypothetical protein